MSSSDRILANSSRKGRWETDGAAPAIAPQLGHEPVQSSAWLGGHDSARPALERLNAGYVKHQGGVIVRAVTYRASGCWAVKIDFGTNLQFG